MLWVILVVVMCVMLWCKIIRARVSATISIAIVNIRIEIKMSVVIVSEIGCDYEIVIVSEIDCDCEIVIVSVIDCEIENEDGTTVVRDVKRRRFVNFFI